MLQEDRDIAKVLHRTGKPVILVVNKIDSKQTLEHLHEFERLGFNKTCAVSAQHGTDITALLEEIILVVTAVELN